MRTLTVTYLYHSGLMVQSNQTLLIFDYWRGDHGQLGDREISAEELKAFKHVIVFVSHDHPDHLDEVIYQWDVPGVNIAYVVSWDFPTRLRGKRMRPNDCIQIGDAVITAYGSTDKGVSYYVEINHCHLFHAGDLNLWHWKEENSLQDIMQAENDFYEKMKPIEELHIDVAMFPVDPRMGGLFDAGANYFVMSVKPRVFLPIHWFDRQEAAKEFARKGKTRYTEVIALTETRETLLITLDDETVSWKTVPDSEYNEKAAFRSNEEDPFSESDLPVEFDQSVKENP